MNASTLYLSHPVHAGYQMLYPDDCYLNEVTRPRQEGNPSSRVDMAYFLGEPNNNQQPGNSTNIFAVVEYKRAQAIDRSQFTAGLVTSFNAFDTAQERSRFANPDNDNDSEDENAAMLLKQAVHYAWRYGTPFVALCDWTTLVLLVMSKQQGSTGGPVRTVFYQPPRRPANIRFSTPILA